MNRIEAKFKELKKKNKLAFIAFITAGYPGLEKTRKLVVEFARRGVDIVELGVPFSDPMADGPIIQEASYRALKKGVNIQKILGTVRKIRLDTQIPICLMTYFNPIFCYGEQRFIKECKATGVDGIIIPDLPLEEGRSLMRLARDNGVDVICFVSPTTSFKRMCRIAKLSRGFIYYVSITGVTGARQNLPDGLLKKLKSLRALTPKPVCVGFGVSSPRQVRLIQSRGAGVIVGSAIVKKIKSCLSDKDLVRKVSQYVSYLKNV